MGNTEVKEVTQHKHLGLTISKDLTWNFHINQVSEKAWKRIGSLRRKKFILDRRTLNKLCITYIGPLLEYGDIIWKNCSQTNKRYIDTLQVEAIGHLTRKSGVLGSIPGLATYFRFSFRFFKKGSCQLLAKVCARSTG